MSAFRRSISARDSAWDLRGPFSESRPRNIRVVVAAAAPPRHAVSKERAGAERVLVDDFGERLVLLLPGALLARLL